MVSASVAAKHKFPARHVLEVKRFVEPWEWMCSETSGAMLLAALGDASVTPMGVLRGAAELHDLPERPGEVGFDEVATYLKKTSLGACRLKSFRSVDQLKAELVETGKPVMISLRSGEGRHSIVVVGYGDGQVYFHEPDPRGKKLTSVSEWQLERAWKAAGRRGVVCCVSTKRKARKKRKKAGKKPSRKKKAKKKR